MTNPVVLFAAATLLVGLAAGHAPAAQFGQAAPPFEADSSVGPIRLADYQGKKNVLLAFYYADFTSG